MNDSLKNLSPLDGRYQNKTEKSRELFSEFALIKQRISVETQWLNYFLTNFKPELLTEKIEEKINTLHTTVPNSLIERVKEIENTTNHDVKAVEIAVAEQFEESEEIQSLVHIFLTSEDINSLSYALMLKEAHPILLDWIENIIQALEDLAEKNKEVAIYDVETSYPISFPQLEGVLAEQFGISLDHVKVKHPADVTEIMPDDGGEYESKLMDVELKDAPKLDQPVYGDEYNMSLFKELMWI